MRRIALATSLCAVLLAGCYSDSARKERALQHTPYTGAVADQTITKARIAHFEKIGDTTAARLEREILSHQERQAISAEGMAQNPALVVPKSVLEVSGNVQATIREQETTR